MHLALTDLFRAKWTNEIHDEWIRNVLKNPPKSTEELLTAYERQRLAQTVAQLRLYAELL